MLGPAEADGPGERDRGGFGEVPEETEPGLLCRVLVLEGLQGLTAPLDIGSQLCGVHTQRRDTKVAMDLDIAQRHARAAGDDTDRCRIDGGRERGQHNGPRPLLERHRAAPDDAGAVAEDCDLGNLRIEFALLGHLITSSVFSRGSHCDLRGSVSLAVARLGAMAPPAPTEAAAGRPRGTRWAPSASARVPSC